MSKQTPEPVRLNLSDAVSDLAPPPPPCFPNRMHWVEYLKSAAAAQTCRTEPKVILISDITREPYFNRDFPFCVDCTQIKSEMMMRKGLCQPDFLNPQPKDSTP